MILIVRQYYGLEAKDPNVSCWAAGIGVIWTGG